MTYDSNGVSEEAGMWLFHFFILKLASSIISARTSLRCLSKTSLVGAFYSYCDILNYSLATYATDYFITVNDFTNCTQPHKETSFSYAQALGDKSLGCSTVYDEARLKGIFIEGLPELIRSSMRHHCSSNWSSSMN